MSLTRVTATLPPDLVERADTLARQTAASRSAVLAEALRAHLDAHGSATARPHRVSEARAGSYPTPAPALLGATNDALVAELARRLGAAPSGAPARDPRDAPPFLGLDQSRLAELCRRHRVRRLSLFGSVLRADFGPDSDVDMLVEFEPGHTPGLAMQGIEDELSALVGGRRVDLVTERSLHPLIRDRVLAGARVLYAA
jgi:hypothetical protein